METINTPYDDTFRTLLQDCPELVVPLINELFGTNYTGREVVVSNENEIFFRNPEGKKEKLQILLERYAYSEIVGTFILI